MIRFQVNASLKKHTHVQLLIDPNPKYYQFQSKLTFNAEEYFRRIPVQKLCLYLTRYLAICCRKEVCKDYETQLPTMTACSVPTVIYRKMTAIDINKSSIDQFTINLTTQMVSFQETLVFCG